MKLSIPRADLVSALAIVKTACVAKSAMPVLSNVALSTLTSKLELTGTDLELCLRTRIKADVQDTGDTTVKASLFYDICRSLTGDQISLQLFKEHLAIECGSSRYKLGVITTSEMPPAVKLKEPEEFDLPQAILRTLLAETSFAHSTDQSRMTLNSSFLRLNGHLTVVGCDGKRVVTEEAEVDLESNPKKMPKLDVIIPARAANELLRLLSDDPDEKKPVRVAIAKNAAQFGFGDTVITTKLIEGDYPDYSRVIPAIKSSVPIGRADLLAALERVSLISEDCTLDFKGQSLVIRSRGNRELPGEAVENLLIPKTGDLTVAFRASYLIEALRAIDSDQIEFTGTRDNGPAVLRAPGKKWVCVTAALVKPNEKAAEESDNKSEPEKEKKPEPVAAKK
jgi:DNA polymerase-3 subunit beta